MTHKGGPQNVGQIRTVCTLFFFGRVWVSESPADGQAHRTVRCKRLLYMAVLDVVDACRHETRVSLKPEGDKPFAAWQVVMVENGIMVPSYFEHQTGPK